MVRTAARNRPSLAAPIPSPRLLARVLRQGRAHAVKVLFNALIRVGRDPAGADRAVLSDLERQWRNVHLPAYRRLVADADTEAATATASRLMELIDRLGREAGIYLWYLAIVGGSAWKMEARLTRFVRQHLGEVLRRQTWQRQRSLAAPLTLGAPARLIGDVIDRAVQEARGPRDVDPGVVVGHPASAGRATGPARIVYDSDDFAAFRDGDVLVAKATAPAWTPLFAKAAAVVTDGGTLAAHASLIAREYGIPAVVGTGNATTRLRPGQLVTVDGTAGTVTPHESSADHA